MNTSPPKKSGTPALPKLTSRKRSLTNPEAIRDFAAKQAVYRGTLKRKNTLAHLDLEKEKEKQKTVKKNGSPLAASVASSVGTASVATGPVGRSRSPPPYLNGTPSTNFRMKKSPSPPLKQAKKLSKSAPNGLPAPVLSEERLAALYRYDILDTPPEISFDDIAKLSSTVCGTPIAAVSLVDKDRQWFKARVGLEPSQTPVDISFCAHALADPGNVMEVKDATKDERFNTNPLLMDNSLNMRFYAAAPLVTADNQALGALCVIDRKARSLTTPQTEALRALSRLTVNQLELRSRSMQLQEAQHKLQILQKELQATNEALAARNAHLETQIKELELNKANDIQLTAPAENVITMLRRIQTQLGDKEQLVDNLDTVIGIIGSHRLYEVDVKDAIQRSGTDLDDQTKGFLITQLHEANPAKENTPSRPSSAAVTLSARHSSIDPYRPALEGFDKWDFDIFNLATVSGGRPITCVGFKAIEHHGLLDKLEFPAHKVMKCLTAIEGGYNPNPYHNNIHAADVLLGSNYLLTSSGIIDHLSNNELFAALFAAIIHDLGHPGVNNAFLIQTGHELAVTHNDRSVLENHHCAQAFKLLQLPENNFMERLSLADRQEIRKTVIELVLATDMAQHVEIFNQFQTKRKTEGLDIVNSKPDRLLVLKMVIKCADISNPARPPGLYKKWVDCIMEEFWRQGDEERKLSMPISAFMDRSVPNVPKCQSGFIQFIAMPTYSAFVEQFPGSQLTLDLMKDNLAYWKSQLEA